MHVNYVANVHNKILFIELYRIAWQVINYDSAWIQPVVSLMGFAKQLNQFSIYGFKLITFCKLYFERLCFSGRIDDQSKREAAHSYKTQDKEVHLRWAFQLWNYTCRIRKFKFRPSLFQNSTTEEEHRWV